MCSAKAQRSAVGTEQRPVAVPASCPAAGIIKRPLRSQIPLPSLPRASRLPAVGSRRRPWRAAAMPGHAMPKTRPMPSAAPAAQRRPRQQRRRSRCGQQHGRHAGDKQRRQSRCACGWSVGTPHAATGSGERAERPRTAASVQACAALSRGWRRSCERYGRRRAAAWLTQCNASILPSGKDNKE